MENRIKNHFEEEAIVYDEIIIKLIPYYKEMIRAIVATIPFCPDREIDIIDLGCGTGTITRAIQQKYSHANFTLVDIADNMLQMAQEKVGSDHCFINADFNSLDFDKQYDVIVSSLALHHLETNPEKQFFYNKIYNALKEGGIFINGDVVQAKPDKLQEKYIEEWIRYMNRSVSMDEIENKWLPNYYAEDRPIPLMDHIDMLHQSGFSDIDVVWKYYGFCVYKGEKNR